MIENVNSLLLIAAVCSALAALLHLGCIAFGPNWYRFFGAGEPMARLAAAGDWRATAITAGITAVLASWSLYAMSGAGLIGKLPLLKPALCAIAAVYLFRGVAGFLFVANPHGRSPQFWIWSSAICLFIAVIHIMGVRLSWGYL